MGFLKSFWRLKRSNRVEREIDYKQLLGEVPFGMAVFEVVFDEKRDPVDYIHCWYNQAYVGLLTLREKNLKGISFNEAFPSVESFWNDSFASVVKNGQPIYFSSFSVLCRRHLGVKVFTLNQLTIGVIVFDITRFQKTEIKLSAHRNKIESMHRAAPIGFGTVVNRVLVDINETLCDMIGYSRKELLYQSTLMLYPSQHEYERVAFLYKNPDEERSNIETLWRKKDGEIINVLLCSSPIIIDNPDDGYVFTALDITEKKKSESRIAEKDGVLRDLDDKYKSTNSKLQQANLFAEVINEQLRYAMKKAEKSERLKTSMLNNISHEIRTPMNAIMGFSQLMVRKIDNPDLLNKYVEIVIEQSNNLLKTIDDIIDLSNLEKDQQDVNSGVFDLNLLFDDIYSFFIDYNKRGGKNHVAFRQPRKNEQVKIIYSDMSKLRQIFSILIQNAFKFSENGFVEFGVSDVNGDTITFFVSDNGIGIPHDKFEVIFDHFSQIESNCFPRTGLGLGLSIAKGLVHLLGGEIWLESEVGKGSTFFFTINSKEDYNSVSSMLSSFSDDSFS